METFLEMCRIYIRHRHCRFVNDKTSPTMSSPFVCNPLLQNGDEEVRRKKMKATSFKQCTQSMISGDTSNAEMQCETHPCCVFSQVAATVLHCVGVPQLLEELDFFDDVLPFLIEIKDEQM